MQFGLCSWPLSLLSSGMASRGSLQWMTMGPKRAAHQERWDNSISMDLYMSVCGAHNSLPWRAGDKTVISCLHFFVPPWRWHERDSSSHKQAVHWRPGGLRVPLHSLHWLSLSTGRRCCWWKEHQHLLQLEVGFRTFSARLKRRPADLWF